MRTAPLLPALALLLTAATPTKGAGVWVPAGPEGGPVGALLVDPGAPAVVYATTDAGLYRSLDGADSWQLLPALPAPLAVPGGRVELHRGAGGTLYSAGLEQYRSDDGGATWQDITIPESGAALTLAPDPLIPNRVFSGNYDGPRRSVDGGDHWQLLTGFPRLDVPGSPDPLLGVEDLTFDESGSTLWAATADGVYRSTTGGDTWQDASGGLVGADGGRWVLALAAVPGTTGRLFASTEGGVYRTDDGGDSWTPAAASPEPGVFVRLVAEGASPLRLWGIALGSGSSTARCRTCRSRSP